MVKNPKTRNIPPVRIDERLASVVEFLHARQQRVSDIIRFGITLRASIILHKEAAARKVEFDDYCRSVGLDPTLFDEFVNHNT